jgi:hypothetical protein
MKRKRIIVGDVFEIPLSDGRKAYGQYVFWDERMGPLIQVFDLLVREEIRTDQLLDRLQSAKPLFPPVITGLFAAISAGFWHVIGHMPVGEFAYPGFISVMHEGYEQRGLWYLWDGEKFIQLGRNLPEKHKHLEFLVVWDPHDIPHRIETGQNPYERLIHGTSPPP